MAPVVTATVLSGFGMGMMWVSLTTVTFSTLDARYRVEGASLFALTRAIGASVGTSLLVTFIVRSTQVNYIEMREHVRGFSESLQHAGSYWDSGSTAGVLELYAVVTAQAQVIGFLNAFVYLFIVSAAAMPLVFLLKTPKRA